MTKDTPEERGLIFLHIPKTAGTTLRTIIDRQYPRDVTYHFYDYPRDREVFFAAPEQWRLSLRVLQGHIEFGFHRHLSVPVHYITLLREPIELVNSLYYWILRTRDAQLYSLADGKSLRHFAESSSPLVNNLQTRLLSGLRTTLRSEAAECTAENLCAASKNLDTHFTAFGLDVRFDESLILFKRRLGWKNVFYTRQNVTRGRPARREMPASTISVIEKNNALDMELYEFAVKKFERVIGEEDSSFRDEVRSFRRLNEAYGALHGCYNLGRRMMPYRAAGFARSLLRKLG